jgi:DNA primase
MRNTWVVIDEIKQQVTLQMVFDHYGLAGKRKGTEVRLHCPFHEDAHPSLSASVAKGAWQCFGCSERGDTITFVALMEGIKTGDRNQDRREAALYLAQTFGIASTRPPRGTSAPRVRAVPEAAPREDNDARDDAPGAVINPPLPFTLNHLDPRHPYLKERGLTDETIATFGVGFFTSTRGVMHGRIVIPIHNAHGELVAYAGRWPGDAGWPEDEDKYKLPPNFRKSAVLYNLHRAKDDAGAGLIVVEGFFPVFDLWQKGRTNVVAIMGCSLSAEQEQLIVQTVGPKGRVLLAFDPDPAGRKGSADAAARLAPQVFVRTVELAL